MKLPRFSIVKLMVVVGVVALNLAATQLWSYSSSPSLLTGRFLTSIALQVGLFRLIQGRRTGSFPFWSGFEACGLAAMLTSVYIDFFSPDDSDLFRMMDSYLFWTFKLIGRVCMLIKNPYYQSKVATALLAQGQGFTNDVTYEIVSAFPQLALALIGGLLASLATKFRGKRSRAEETVPGSRA